MSCMEHLCRNCGHEWFDNAPRASCPLCKTANVTHTFDERSDDDGVGESP